MTKYIKNIAVVLFLGASLTTIHFYGLIPAVLGMLVWISGVMYGAATK